MSTTPEATTTRRIKRFAPLQLGKMMGVMYGIMGLIFCPIFMVASAFAPAPRTGAMVLGTGFALFLPILYGGLGFVAGVISAFIYNVIAKWIGGIEVEVE